MNDSRTKNSIRNSFWTVLFRISVIVFPFIIRTIILKEIGEECLGITTLYKSIIQVLNVSELGLNSAICASLYKPIAEKDREKICGLLYLFRKLYKIIASFMLFAGLAVMPFLNTLLKGEATGQINIYLLWVLYLLTSIVSYMLYAYDVSLIYAHQRGDITRKIDISLRIIEFAFQFYVIVVFKSIIAYIFVKLVYSIVYNLVCKYYCDKYYPGLLPNGNIDKEDQSRIFNNIKSLALQKIGNTISTSLDAVIISAFMGITTVAIYGNYNYVLSAIVSIIYAVCSSLTASVGNSVVEKDIEKNYLDFKKISFLNFWLVGWCSICFMVIFQDFMTVWAGTHLLFTMPIVLTLVLRFYFHKIRGIVSIYKDATGLWEVDKWRPVVGCLVNLVFNITLVNWIGVAGVAISTIISYVFVEAPWETHALFTHYFKRSELDYYKELLLCTVSTIIVGTITYYVCLILPVTGIIAIAVKLVICFSLPNILFIIINFKNPDFKIAWEFLLRILKTTKRMLIRKS